jgi:hypothetical protein
MADAVIWQSRPSAFGVAAISAMMFVCNSAGASSPGKPAALVAKDAPDSAIARASFGVHSSGASDVLKISIGHSMVLTTASPLRRIYIGNPTVLTLRQKIAAETVSDLAGTRCIRVLKSTQINDLRKA